MRAGIDFPLKHILGPATVTKLRDPKATLPQCDFHHDWGLSYQKCRSCERGLGEVPYLRKYAVRHYICEACLAYVREKRGH